MKNNKKNNIITEDTGKKNKFMKNAILFFSFILLGASLTLGGCTGKSGDSGQAAKENTGNVSDEGSAGEESGGAGERDEDAKDSSGEKDDGAGDNGTEKEDGSTDEGGTDKKDESVDDGSSDTGEGNSDDGGTQEKTEVRREDFPDCDGSGHGYYEIHYSDGSTEIEEY